MGTGRSRCHRRTARGPAARPTCCSPITNDMPVAGGNLGNQRYSTLARINRQNIHNLGAAWRTDVSAVAQATPTPTPRRRRSSSVASSSLCHRRMALRLDYRLLTIAFD
jgi:hypothetical protein